MAKSSDKFTEAVNEAVKPLEKNPLTYVLAMIIKLFSIPFAMLFVFADIFSKDDK